MRGLRNRMSAALHPFFVLKSELDKNPKVLARKDAIVCECFVNTQTWLVGTLLIAG